MPAAEPSFIIDCHCGATLRGRRLAQCQTIPCAACGRPVFVLPMSPLPADRSLANGTAPEYPALRVRHSIRLWIAPASAAVIALAVIAVIIAAIVNRYRDGAYGESESSARRRWTERLDAAQAAVNDGAYRTAANELFHAAALHARFPGIATPAEAESYRRTQRQVALLADLLPESIEEIMHHALGQSDAEWRTVFADRYAGRSVILDATIFRDHTGRFRVDYQLEMGGLAGEWDLQRLALLGRLSLQRPQRLMIGMRLADVARASRDSWTVRPVPDSGVLFTDEALLKGLSIAVDDGLREVLRRQAGWEAEP